MNKFKTEQELFWAGEFGDNYISRNKEPGMLAASINMFSKVLEGTKDVNSVIEFGANIGLNLLAIRALLPHIGLSAIELNGNAVGNLKRIEGIKIYHQSMLEFTPDYERDLVFTRGVLIHINPDMLPRVYDLLYETSKSYICIAEYYNPTPVALDYRGYKNRLFKRDFAGEMLDRFDELELVRYGFVYHRDDNHPQDDINWFLLRKRNMSQGS
jgi:pseudaminic acid biosynthesis-associated methylase